MSRSLADIFLFLFRLIFLQARREEDYAEEEEEEPIATTF